MTEFHTKTWYNENMNERVTVKLKDGTRRKVRVMSSYLENRRGSYERGVYWTSTTYGMISKTETRAEADKRRLPRTRFAPRPEEMYSCDGGVTWHLDPRKARASRGRVKLASENRKELAWDAIQRINREYYRW